MAGDHLVVLDAGRAKCLLHAPARVYTRAAVIAVADEQRRSLGHAPPRKLSMLTNDLLKSCETVRPALLVQRAPCLRRKRPLHEDNFGRLAEIRERQRDDRLSVVGSGSSHRKV